MAAKTVEVKKYEYNANKFKVIKGEDVSLIIHVFNPDFSNMALVNSPSLQTKLPKEGGGMITLENVSHAVLNGDPGIVKLSLNAETTAQLKVGENQPIQIVVTMTAYGQPYKRVVQITEALTVVAQIE